MKRKLFIMLSVLFVVTFVFVGHVFASNGADAPTSSITINTDFLSAAAGVLLSLGFSYIPKLSTWYAALDSTKKSLIMLGLLVVLSIGLYGLGCAKLVGLNIACTTDGAWQLVEIFIAAAIANQSTYTLSPQTTAVKEVKLS